MPCSYTLPSNALVYGLGFSSLVLFIPPPYSHLIGRLHARQDQGEQKNREYWQAW